MAGPAARAIAGRLPEAVSAAVIDFITGALIDNPPRVNDDRGITAFDGSGIYRFPCAAIPSRHSEYAAGKTEMAEERIDDEVDLDGGVWAVYSTQIIMLMVVAVIAIGTVVYRFLEDWDWVDSLYFTVVTLTSVGYGDLAPTSSGAKLFTVVYIVTGISLLGAALNEMLKRRGRKVAAKRTRRRSRPESPSR